MKQLKLFILAFAIISIVFIGSCGQSPEPSLNLQQRAARVLDEGSPWGGPGNVEVLASPAGVDFSQLLNLQLDFRSSGPDNWAPTFFNASGATDFISTLESTWIWSGSGTEIITLFQASINEFTSVDVTDTQVTLSFEVNPQSSSGRISGIDGSYTVRLR